jgi:hypothetical protein
MNATGAAAGGQDGGHRIPVAGGTASAVIDLAGEPDEPRRGGHDPSVPQIMTTLAVRGKLLVGHTRSLSDESAPIDIEREAYPGARLVDLRCTACVARVDVGQLDGATLAVLGHEPGCEWLARMLRRAGRAS